MKIVIGGAVAATLLLAWWRWDRVLISRRWKYESSPDLYGWRYLLLEVNLSFRERQREKP